MNYDWKLLDELRAGFLAQRPVRDYWQSGEVLAQYEATYAQRIGWKWRSVTGELAERGWHPRQGSWLVDWGCGTGIASRKVLEAWPARFAGADFWDRSRLACEFAARKISELRPDLPVGPPSAGAPICLVLSHVIGELLDSDLSRLFTAIAGADSVLWVEPGTPELSRKLIGVREELRGQFDVVAPCPHQSRCGVLSRENDSHWCHHFAKTPSEVFQSAFWREFSETLGIDLRSLPTSFLVLQRSSGDPRPDVTRGRLIGKARTHGGFAEALVCREKGVREEKVLRRTHPDRWKRLRDSPFTVLFDPE